MEKLLFNNDKHPVSETGTALAVFSTVLKKLSMVVIILLTAASLHAQVIMELNDWLEQSKSSADPVMVSDAIHLEKLIKELQPTVYIANTVIPNSGKQPVCANAKPGYVDQLSLENPLFSNVELLTIRLKSQADLNFILDLDKLTGFTNLKYVYFICEMNCNIEDVQKLFLPKSGITVFYKVSIPS